MRIFVAVNLPPDVRERLHAAAAPLREAAPDVKWVGADKLHLTVKFLGEQPAEMAERGAAALREVAARHRPFDMELRGAGTFPNRRAPNVVWAGVTAEPRLELLHHDVETAFDLLGCPIEGRAFRPHVTLGRVRQGRGRDQARAIAEGLRQMKVALHAEVRSLDLMESALGAAGSRYTVLHEAALGTP